MSEPATTKNIGLRGVKVADTKISHVDGENGILIYRGYRIEDLAKNSTFEETAYLLLHDRLPGASQLEEFSRQLVRARQSRASFSTRSRTCRMGPLPWTCSRPRSRSWPWQIPILLMIPGKRT